MLIEKGWNSLPASVYTESYDYKSSRKSVDRGSSRLFVAASYRGGLCPAVSVNESAEMM